jgi:hypothetical protein
LIHAVFAWAKNRVSIPTIGFGIGEKLANAKYCLSVQDRYIHSQSMLAQRNTETSCHIKLGRVIIEELITSGALNNKCSLKVQFILN